MSDLPPENARFRAVAKRVINTFKLTVTPSWQPLRSMSSPMVLFDDALTLEEVVTEIALVPSIGTLAEPLTAVFEAIERSRVNRSQWKLMQHRCARVVFLAGARVKNNDKDFYPGLEAASGMLRDTLGAVAARAQHYNEMSLDTEFFQFEAISEDIRRLFGTLDACLAQFLYPWEVAESQWIERFSIIQEQELEHMNRIREKLLGRNTGPESGKVDETWTDNKSVEKLESKRMSAREMFECLKRHGCQDLTQRVDMKTISNHAVATGAYGDIWKGRLDDSTDVAIKVWSFRRADEAPHKSLKGAMRELYNWSKADHTNIQKLLGVVMFKDRLGMVSRWMGNGNLQDYIRQHQPEDRYRLCMQAAIAVQHLHREQMVHGDLKACNLLVSSAGGLKLTDFDTVGSQVAEYH